MPQKRTCDVENLADFSRYYNNSWVGWHDDKGVKPCFVGGPVSQTEHLFRNLGKRDSGGFSVDSGFPASWATIKEQMDFGVPDIGMVQDGPTIQFMSYATPRAARKGFRSRESVIAEFNNWDIRRKYVTANGIGERYDIVSFVFNPTYSSLVEAEDKLAKGELVGVPLSRTLGVYSSPKFKTSLLAYKRWTVGHVVSPYLIQLKSEYADYEEDIARQTGAEVIIR